MGTGVALAALGAVELGHRLLWGAPPGRPNVGRAGVVELVLEGENARLVAPDPRSEVVVPLAHVRARVIVVGGSSVRDWSPEPQNWPWWLDQQLPSVDVVNLGSPGLTATGVAALVEQLAPLTPDLVVVYTGHNDTAQAVFSRDVEGSGGWRLMAWALIGQSWLAHRLSPEASPNVAARASVVVTEDDLALTNQDAVDAEFETALRRLIEGSPAPVVLTTLMRNFDWGPQGVLTRDPACRAHVQGVGPKAPLHPAADARTLLELCGETARGDWLEAHAALRAKDPDAALEHWYRSLAMDPYPLRAPARTDATIRRVAQQTGTPLVDLEATLGPFAQNASFKDTLHPSERGAEQIALAVAPAVKSALAGRAQ
jgi:lysophospholipase L1-like esterase